MANTALSLILQVVRLAEIPDNVSPDLLRLGIQMNIPSVHSATEHTGQERFGRLYILSRISCFIPIFSFVNPLPVGEYEGEFIGAGGVLVGGSLISPNKLLQILQPFQTKTILKIRNESANVFLDNAGPNSPITVERRSDQTKEISICYEGGMVTDKVDKDMYFCKFSSYKREL